MLESGLTPASLIGALAYLATCALALAAAQGPWRSRVVRPGRWRLVGLIFFALVCWRLGMGEIRLQDDVRAWTRIRGIYEDRHEVQGIVTVALLALAAAGVALLALRGGGGRSMLALWAALGLVLLSLGRLASLHALDELLYRTGPVHLNYLLDMGMTGCAGWLALLEITAARSSMASSRGGPSRRSLRS